MAGGRGGGAGGQAAGALNVNRERATDVRPVSISHAAAAHQAPCRRRAPCRYYGR